MRGALCKALRTSRIEISNQLAYKANFLLQVIGPAVVFLLIKINLWTSIFTIRDGAPVGGYSREEMLQYQVLVFVVVLLSQSFITRNIAEDIRMGRISSYLLYPFSFQSVQFGSFLGVQTLNILSAAVMVLVAGAFGISLLAWNIQTLAGIAMVAIVSLLWFWIWLSLSFLSFWVEETWVFRVCFTMIVKFLSGSILPLSFFPELLRDTLSYSPFPYMTYVPVELLAGRFSGSLTEAFGTLLIWTIVVVSITQVLWRRGLRLYCAAGI